ncbi:MAG: ABC transporter permease subunit [Alphaproteobacteria bacterium]|jgi:putative spermidine/putrescine transport system permease protein|nr:ABC transporter permease subunit [Alphaproteobacteria bacterium]
MVGRIPLGARLAAAALVLAVVFFMLAPLAVIVGASLTAGQFLSFPPQGLSVRWYADVVDDPAYLSAAWTSLKLAVAVTVAAVAIGTPAAIAIARHRFRGSAALSALFLSPLILPTIIFGIGLLIFFSVYGDGPSFLAMWLGHTVITLPYVIRTVVAVLEDSDPYVEEAARTMGANWWQRHWFGVLPQCAGAMAAGAFFAFNISFDEAVIALFLRTPGLETLPLKIYAELEFSPTPAVAAVSSIMIGVTVVLIVAIERLLGLNRVTG